MTATKLVPAPIKNYETIRFGLIAGMWDLTGSGVEFCKWRVGDQRRVDLERAEER